MCRILLSLPYLFCFSHMYCSARKCQYQFYAENIDDKKLVLPDIFCCVIVVDTFQIGQLSPFIDLLGCLCHFAKNDLNNFALLLLPKCLSVSYHLLCV